MDKRKALSLIIVLACVFTTQAQNKKDLYLDINAPHHERILDLLSKLTIEEKISLLRATSPGIPRLQIDKYYHGNEALHGVVRPGKFTVFPKLSDWQLCGTLNCCTKFQLQSRTRHAPDGMS
jgi:beta-glucosidase